MHSRSEGDAKEVVFVRSILKSHENSLMFRLKHSHSVGLTPSNNGA